MKPANLAGTVQNDLRSRQGEFIGLYNNKELLNKIFSGKLSDKEVANLVKLPYQIYAYENDVLIFWNTNKVLANCERQPNESNGLIFNEKGFFIRACYTISKEKNRQLTVLFPITTVYPFENQYLLSQFEAGRHIPMSARLFRHAVKGGFEVKDIYERTVFHIKFDESKIPGWAPNPAMIGLLLAALLSTIAWLQLISINLSRKKSNFLGLFITLAIVIGFRLLTYMYGLPFNLENLPIFSPTVYATSQLHPSLGDLLLNALCFLWIVAYLIGNISFSTIDFSNTSKTIRVSIAIFLSLLMTTFAFTLINMISSLVVDSMIPFDVSHFYNINKYTIYGLFTIGLITISCCLLLYLLNVIVNKLLEKRVFKYLLIVVIGVILILFSDVSRTGNLSYYLLAWLVIFIMLLDVKQLAYTNDILAPHMIFWAFFVCVFCTAVLQYFNSVKEKEARIRFAEEIVQQRDYLTEDVTFKIVSEGIKRDRALLNFINNPSKDARRQLNEQFEMFYFGGQLNKYQAHVFLFDEDGRSLYNNDTVSYNVLWKQIKKALPTSDSTLYYKPYAQDGHYYIATIPITDESSHTRKGFVFVDLAVKESTGETVYPELLQPGRVKSNKNEAEYSYAIYANNKLITQTNDYAFPGIIQALNTNQYIFKNNEGNSELWYHEETDKTKAVIVVHKQRLWLDSITLFSYLFGIQVLIAILIVAYKSILSFIAKPKRVGRFVSFTLRRRIHFSMLSIVFISFIIIGGVTVVYFTLQYREGTRAKLLRVVQVIDRSIIQYLDQQNGLSNPGQFNRLTNTDTFKYFITNLSNAQKIDINVFSASGVLNVTSQDNIYDRALLARIMRQDAYYLLSVKRNTLLTQDENIGRLSYLSCYMPIRDEEGNTMGYLNIPYYSSQKELSYQISNILVALINLYAFIFLLSGLLTVFITRWITRSFNVVIQRFEKLNLSKNELIEWPYNDEIGVLVEEYNKMVKKVEENAMLMAQNERESAWREMAQQVAHEIKNPLTPMKLNIQYLQQALRNKLPNIEELTAKVSESMIEQIDNLSYIASEFSNFAKIPEARPEYIDVNILIAASAELYLNDTSVKVVIDKEPEPLIVFADRSQLLRVFTNLLQNAVQSIPEDREGSIVVKAKKENNHVVISFADNGTGIDSDIIEKIFQPNFTTKSSGTGLGLAMTKKIIEFWKGEIWFETKMGKGTIFYIRLPLSYEG